MCQADQHSSMQGAQRRSTAQRAPAILRLGKMDPTALCFVTLNVVIIS